MRKYHPNYSGKSPAPAGEKAHRGDSDNPLPGLYRCPYLGCYCKGPPGKTPAECKGREECFRIEFKPWIAQCFGDENRVDISSNEV